jgi:2,4-dienoyl-CoA reductase-like NADH-dependent reductase (Old Yellow Enzyme family)
VTDATRPHLFTPLTLRAVSLRNRIVVSPMCQYTAVDGLAGDWHLVNLSKFAIGGAGLVFCEAAGVEPAGRITHGCVGFWDDDLMAPWPRITDFVKAHGAVPGAQIAHAGRKASTQRPWEGAGPLGDAEAERRKGPWQTVAASAEAAGKGWHVPEALEAAEITGLVDKFAAAARRAIDAGFEVIEVHGAHGYLIHSFLSPLANHRNDEWGGDLKGRMRFALAVAEAVRGAMPDEAPLFFRISSVDGGDGVGWTLDDSVVLAKELKALGVDVVDCSSGGIDMNHMPAARLPRGPAFQVPYAERLRADADIATMAVGLITEAEQAEAIVRDGRADLVALARELMSDPHWPAHAAIALGAEDAYRTWPDQIGWWIEKRDSRPAAKA